MPRSDQSVAILTGLIFAALYVILLVGVVQEGSAWRQFPSREAVSRAEGSSPLVGLDGSRRVCGADLPQGVRRAMGEGP
jgi:hypothetical protein